MNPDQLSSQGMFAIVLFAILAVGTAAASGAGSARNYFSYLALYLLGFIIQKLVFNSDFLDRGKWVITLQAEKDKIFFAGQMIETEAEEAHESRFLGEALTGARPIGIVLGMATVFVAFLLLIFTKNLNLTFSGLFALTAAMSLVPVMSLNHYAIPLVLNFSMVFSSLLRAERGPLPLYLIYTVLVAAWFVLYRCLELETGAEEGHVAPEKLAMKTARNSVVYGGVFLLIVAGMDALLPDHTIRFEGLRVPNSSKLHQLNRFLGKHFQDFARKRQSDSENSANSEGEGGSGSSSSQPSAQPPANQPPQAEKPSPQQPQSQTPQAGPSQSPAPRSNLPQLPSSTQGPEARSQNPSAGAQGGSQNSTGGGSPSEKPGNGSGLPQMPKFPDLPQTGNPFGQQPNSNPQGGPSQGSGSRDDGNPDFNGNGPEHRLPEQRSKENSGAENPDRPKGGGPKSESGGPKAKSNQDGGLLPEKTVDMIERAVKPLLILFAGVILIYLLKKFAKRKSPKAKPLRKKLHRKQKHEILESFRELEAQILNPRDEIIARYQLFLQIMEAAQTPREEHLPPTDYYHQLKYLYPSLQRESELITLTFCDAFYGELPIDPALVGKYRASVDTFYKALS